MHKGYLLLVLHAHLPYVRHPEHEYFLEENWLNECLIETYIPLLEMLERLADEGVDFRVTLSVSPTLLEMLTDELLKERFLRYMGRLIELTEKEIKRTRNSASFGPLARMYNENLKKIRYLYEEHYRGDITAPLKRLASSGKVELITTAATHAYLPNLSHIPSAVKTQVELARLEFMRYFLGPPQGMWLPECGYYEGLDYILKEAGVKFSFLASHGILLGRPRPEYGVFKPVRCPSGLAVFGRDRASSEEVWSLHGGYPGDPDYRDFYRDIGYDLSIRYIRPYIHPEGIRIPTGIKYYRITGKGRKRPYVREHALRKARLHAEDFIAKRQKQVREMNDTYGFSPVITAPYDAELFGHWWFEGIVWLEHLLRGLSLQRTVKMTTPSEYLGENPALQMVAPTLSSWGKGAYSTVWCSHSNHWALRHIHEASKRMTALAGKFKRADDPLIRRALNQALRELLLMQASDWPFMIEQGTSPHYGEERLSDHISAFNRLFGMLTDGHIAEDRLKALEDRDRIFEFIDYRLYGRSFS